MGGKDLAGLGLEYIKIFSRLKKKSIISNLYIYTDGLWNYITLAICGFLKLIRLLL
jgi:hypothetical protein